jgi:hypothetical protein
MEWVVVIFEPEHPDNVAQFVMVISAKNNLIFLGACSLLARYFHPSLVQRNGVEGVDPKIMQAAVREAERVWQEVQNTAEQKDESGGS